jgi:hypothetical protein
MIPFIHRHDGVHPEGWGASSFGMRAFMPLEQPAIHWDEGVHPDA